MTTRHDPYLNTAKRELVEKKNKIRKAKIEEKKKKKEKSFFSKNIVFSDYIYLPEYLQSPFLAIIFITIPYLSGLVLLYLFVYLDKIEAKLIAFNFNYFLLTWTIGYEITASLLLLLIFKSALTFKAQNINNDTLVQKTL